MPKDAFTHSYNFRTKDHTFSVTPVPGAMLLVIDNSFTFSMNRDQWDALRYHIYFENEEEEGSTND